MISDSRGVSDDSVRLVDMRNSISGTDEEGRALEPQDDLITILFDIINMAEIESPQRSKKTEEVSADGSDNDDNASQCSAGSRREEPHPGYRVEAKLPDNATPDEVAQAAAKTAADVREWNRLRGRVDDETLIFPPQRWKTLEQALGSAQLITASWTLSTTPTSPRCVPAVRSQGSLRVPWQSSQSITCGRHQARKPHYIPRRAGRQRSGPQQLQNRNQISKSRSSGT